MRAPFACRSSCTSRSLSFLLAALFLLAAAPRARGQEGGTGPLVTRYDFTGNLIDPEPTLRAVFGTLIKVGEPWDAEKKKEVEELAGRLAYRTRFVTSTTGAGVALRIELTPSDRVRHVEVHGNFPLRAEEIRSRLELRPGGALAEDGPARLRQLREDEGHILDYLRRLAYFDARVDMALERGAQHEFTLAVYLVLGTRYRIGKVKVEGNSAIDSETITGHIHAGKKWERFLAFITAGLLYEVGFEKEQLDEDLDEIQRMYQDAGYPRAQVTSTYNPSISLDRLKKTVNFKILIDEGKRIDVVFEGNDDGAISDRELRRVLTFNAEKAYDDYEVQQSKLALRDLYQKNGFFQAIIAAERVPLTPEFERIIFYIDAGPRLRVESIQFAGNQAFTAGRLKKLISTREHPGRLAFAFSGGYVTSLQLQQDVDAVVDFYHAQGFPNAQVQARVAMDPRLLEDMGALAGAITSEEPGDLHIRFEIVEGERDTVEARDFVGNKPPVTDAILAARTRLAAGVPYTEARMNADVEAIIKLYGERGYARATVQPEVSGAGSHVRVRYLIEEGEPARLGKIVVRGNFKTKEWVVREVLGLKEGELLTTGRIEAGQLALRTTDLFTSVYPEYIGFKDQSGPVHLLIDVEERHDETGALDIPFGYSTDNGPYVGVTVTFPNIWGTGLNFSLAAEASVGNTICPQICRVNGSFTIPQWALHHWLRLPFKLDITGRGRVDNSDPRFGELDTLGFTVAFSRLLATGVYLSLRYDYNLFNRPKDLIRPAGPSETSDTTQIQTTTATVGPAFTVDRRRNESGIPSPLSPSAGYLFSAAAAVASPYLGGSDFFLKLNVSAQVFVGFGGRVVFSNAVRYDQGVPLGDSALLPEVERFAAGGDTTVRGFEEDRLHTEIVRDPLAPAGVDQFKIIPAGGNIRFIWNADLQVRVVDHFIGSLPLASAIFVDTGLVTNSLDGFRLDKLRHSLGIAFARLITPFGNLSFEWAIPLDPQLGDDPTGRLHFNFGFVF